MSGRNYLIRIRSAGPNGAFEPNYWNTDDFDVWKNYIDFFSGAESEINEILNKEINIGKKPFPKDDAELRSLLKRNGLDLASVKDGYGDPVTLWVHDVPRYVGKTVFKNGKQVIKPATDIFRVFSVRGHGTERARDEDVELASLSSVVTEMTAANQFSKADVNSVAFSGAKGAIHGTSHGRSRGCSVGSHDHGHGRKRRVEDLLGNVRLGGRFFAREPSIW